MKTAYSTIIVAAGMAFASPVWAACNVTQSGLVSHTESDCASAGDLSALDGVVVSQGGQIAALQSDKADKTRLDTFGPSNAAPAGSLENWAGGVNATLGTHNGQIAALENLTAAHGATLTAHTALLSQHTKRLDEHAKGIAIATSLPDAWLSDKKRFGIFGSVGGFEGETAVGFAVIGRLDETFSINAKLGADTDFDHVGWQVGVGAQW